MNEDDAFLHCFDHVEQKVDLDEFMSGLRSRLPVGMIGGEDRSPADSKWVVDGSDPFEIHLARRLTGERTQITLRYQFLGGAETAFPKSFSIHAKSEDKTNEAMVYIAGRVSEILEEFPQRKDHEGNWDWLGRLVGGGSRRGSRHRRGSGDHGGGFSHPGGGI